MIVGVALENVSEQIRPTNPQNSALLAEIRSIITRIGRLSNQSGTINPADIAQIQESIARLLTNSTSFQPLYNAALQEVRDTMRTAVEGSDAAAAAQPIPEAAAASIQAATSSHLEVSLIPSAQNGLKAEHYVKVGRKTFKITVTLPSSNGAPVALHGSQWQALDSSFTQLITTAGSPKKAQFDLFGDRIDIQAGTNKRTEQCPEGSPLASLSDAICQAFEGAKPLAPEAKVATNAAKDAKATPDTAKATGKKGEPAKSTPEAPSPELLGPATRSTVAQLASDDGQLDGFELLTALHTLGVQGNFGVLTNGETLYTQGTIATAAPDIAKALKTHNQIVVPIHLRGQHWGALFVEKQTGVWNTLKRAKPVVRFYDPYGEDSIPEGQTAALNQVSMDVSGSPIASMPPETLRQRQGDETRCGTFVVAQTARQFGMSFLPKTLIDPLIDPTRLTEARYQQFARAMGKATATHLKAHPAWIQKRVQTQKGTFPVAEALDARTNHFLPSGSIPREIRIVQDQSSLEAIRDSGAGNPLVLFPNAGSDPANEAILSSALVLGKPSDREEKFFPKVLLTRAPAALGYAELEQPAAIFSPFFFKAISEASTAQWLELGLAKGAGEIFIQLPAIPDEQGDFDAARTAHLAGVIKQRLEETLATPDFNGYHPEITLFQPQADIISEA